MSRSFALVFCLAFLAGVQATGVFYLYGFDSPNPTAVGNVRDGSMLYLASSDKAVKLSKITLSTNGQTITLDKLLASFDDNGFTKGWSVNSDLTIATTNDANTTNYLSGFFFISSPEMANDPNFLVYLVSDQKITIDRLTNTETTLVLLNLRKEKSATDPVYKPLYNTRVENFQQPKTTKLYMYHDTPEDGYTDPFYTGTVQKMILANPVSLYPTGNPDADTYFFDNIEPVQFSRSSWHIRAVGGIKFDVSQNYVDSSTYTTTNQTTTGYTMNQRGTYNSTINLKSSNDPNVLMGLLVSTELFSNVDIYMCNALECSIKNLIDTQQLAADYSQEILNATAIYVVPSSISSGLYYVQYFRIEGYVPVPIPTTTPGSTTGSVPTNPAGSSVTTPKSVESTTKSAATLLTIFSLVIPFLYFSWA